MLNSDWVSHVRSNYTIYINVSSCLATINSIQLDLWIMGVSQSAAYLVSALSRESDISRSVPFFKTVPDH